MASWLIVARRWLLLSSHHCREKLIRQDINFPNLSDRRLSCFCRHSDELKLIEFCSFSADKKCVIIIQILRFILKSLFLLSSRLKKRFCHFFFHSSEFCSLSWRPPWDMRTFSQWARTCVDENECDGGGMQTWLGLAWLGCPTSTPSNHHPPPPGSCGGSDKDGFPDQDQSDSWVPEEDGWIWDWDGPRVPRGPSGLLTYVQWNDTNDLIS